MKKILTLLCMTVCTLRLPAQSISAKLDTLLSAYTQIHEFNGSALVYSHGKVLLHKAYGWKNKEQRIPNDTNTVFRLASITKTMTSTLILELAEQHKLSLDDKLSKYFPGFPHGDSITIEHLLKHTSGLYNYTKDGEFMTQEITKHATEEKILSLFRDKPLDFSPGTGWEYSNSGYHLLGGIIERVTKINYFDAMRKYVFWPLNMQQSGFNFTATGYNPAGPALVVDSSICYSAGAVCSTTGDLLKYHKALQSHKLVSAASQNLAYTKLTNHYGYGWQVDSIFGKRVLSHSGGIHGFRTNLARIEEDDVCIVLLCNEELNSIQRINQGILSILYDKPYKVPVVRTPIKVPAAELKKYEGKYKFDVNQLVVEVKLENDRLVAYPQGNAPSVLVPFATRQFHLENESGFIVRFDETGNMFIDNGTGPERKATKL